MLHLYDAATGRIIDTGLAVGHAVGRDVSLYTFPLMPVISEAASRYLWVKPNKVRPIEDLTSSKIAPWNAPSDHPAALESPNTALPD